MQVKNKLCVFAIEADLSSIKTSLIDQFLKCLFVKGYLQCIDSATASLVEKYSLQIQTLTYSQAIAPLTANQPVPQGCAVAISSDRCTVNLMLKVTNCLFFFPYGIFVWFVGCEKSFNTFN